MINPATTCSSQAQPLTMSTYIMTLVGTTSSHMMTLVVLTMSTHIMTLVVLTMSTHIMTLVACGRVYSYHNVSCGGPLVGQEPWLVTGGGNRLGGSLARRALEGKLALLQGYLDHSKLPPLRTLQ